MSTSYRSVPGVRSLHVAALAAALLLLPAASFAQRTSVARDFPVYPNGDKPDLVVDPQRFVAQMEIVDRYFDPGDCAIAEGVVGAPGYRRLLRFDTVLMNRGDGDLVIGDRSDPENPYAPYFVFHACHGHYHLRDFSMYELLTSTAPWSSPATSRASASRTRSVRRWRQEQRIRLRQSGHHEGLG